MPVAPLNRVSFGFAHSARALGRGPGHDHGWACVVRQRVAGEGRLLVLLVLLVLRATTIFRCHEGSCYTAETHSEHAVTAARITGQVVMRAYARRLLRQRLSTQVVIATVAILVVTMAAGFVVVQWTLNRQLNEQYEQRALAVAQSLASQPGLQQAVSAGDPGGISPRGVVQSMANAAMDSTHAKFVVVTNARGIRLSHPNPRRIGMPVWYPDREPTFTEPFRTGRTWTGIQHGTLGIEAVGKAPLFSHGKLIGQVSVGFFTTTVTR